MGEDEMCESIPVKTNHNIEPVGYLEFIRKEIPNGPLGHKIRKVSQSLQESNFCYSRASSIESLRLCGIPDAGVPPVWNFVTKPHISSAKVKVVEYRMKATTSKAIYMILRQKEKYVTGALVYEVLNFGETDQKGLEKMLRSELIKFRSIR